MPEKLLKLFPLVKLDEATHTVWGVVTSETPDADGEICDYPEAKLEIKKWSDEAFAKTTAAGQDPSLGNMRVMHQLEVGGKAIKIEYKDDPKQIWVGSEPANDDVWHLLKGGFLSAHSIGGAYKWKRKEGEYTRYAPTIGEISYVDKGSNPDASFSYVKADGSTELRKFAKLGPEEEKLLQKLGTPVMTLSVDDLRAEMNTGLEKIRAVVAEFMAQTTGATGANSMKPEDIKKCAAALGISEEDFKKTYLTSDALQKAKSGLAGLHGHISGAMEHHEKMMGHHSDMVKAHAAMATMHEKHSAHLAKCDKACKAIMGDDEKEAEKALKTLLAELAPASGNNSEFVSIGKTADGVEVFRKAEIKVGDQKIVDVKTGEGSLSKSDLEAALKAQREEFEKKLGELPKPDPQGLRIVPRVSAEEVRKAQESGIPDAIPAI